MFVGFVAHNTALDTCVGEHRSTDIVSTNSTVSRANVANKSSALFCSSFIVNCGVGTSNAVRDVIGS